jgi:cell division septation protein DedD
VFDIFRLEAEPPPGMVVSGISTDSGQVVADNAIEWYGPPPQVYFSDFYFDAPTPTPTATSTPTSTPSPTPTFTPTPQPTLTLPPTPTATPVSFDIWLPLLRR